MEITRAHGVEGAATASGPTVVIDVFRAFTAAAYALAAGAEQIVLTSEVAKAIEIAAAIPGAVLMGEVSGIRPDEFPLGNSPDEIVARPEAVKGRTVVHRSSAGTRCARAALGTGASPIYIASLVVASATATATAAALAGSPSVTIVASGESGVRRAEEDDLAADLIEALLHGDRTGLVTCGDRVAATDRAGFLNSSSFAHADDVALCSQTDRFSFAMRAETIDGLVRVRAV